TRATNGGESGNARLTFGEAMATHQQSLKDNRNLKPSTIHYWQQIFAALTKSWPGLKEKEIRRITVGECRGWAAGFARDASPTRVNNTFAALRHVFRVALNAGVIYRDPSAGLTRVRIRAKQLALPSREDFCRLVETIEAGRGRYSRACAEFVRGLAYTGMRKGEAAGIEWRDLLFAPNEIVVRGDSETGTKNWETRRVPMIPEARALFTKMRSLRGHEPGTAKVFRVRESQKSIDAACKKLDLARVTHHDFRHLFATTCIEAGVDIPTVARFLGHKDGGALAMKTYGHLRREHGLEQARKVSFAV
ncbi:MAG TPA: site-specific integrase, partial [Chthoniobacterales bacterium]|nr:site-specific integrase [Chthoniobacterales bacterium]